MPTEPCVGFYGQEHALILALAAHNLLTVPYLHYYSRLSLAPQDSLGETNASLAYLSNSLFNTYSKLLHQARSQFDLMDPALLPPAGAKRNSYNLLLTTEFMHFIPRTSQAVKIPVLKRDGEESNDETTEVVLNGLAYAGFWFVGTEKEKAEIEAYGLSRILAEAAYPREVRWRSYIARAGADSRRRSLATRKLRSAFPTDKSKASSSVRARSDERAAMQ